MKLYFSKASETLHDSTGYYFLSGTTKIYINSQQTIGLVANSFLDRRPAQDGTG